MRTKIISILLATMVMVSSLPAGVLGDALSNVTPAGVYQSKDANGNTKQTTVYSGAVYFRFNPSTPKPIFVVSPPSIEAGCNGINIKGMFLSLLGLGQLKEMVQRAPATLAMGVVVGLVYSLPSVASAFRMVNQWAKDLQNLLGNSCQSGIAIGKSLGDKYIGKSEFGKKINGALSDVIPECQQAGANCAASAMGLGEYFSKDGVFKTAGEDFKMSDQEILDSLNSLFRGIFQADTSIAGAIIQGIVKIGGAGGNFMKALSPGGKPSEMINKNKPFETKTFFITANNKTSGTPPAGSQVVSIEDLGNTLAEGSVKTMGKQHLLEAVLLYNYVGDIMIKSTKRVIDSALVKYTDQNASNRNAAAEFENLQNFGVKFALAGPGALTTASSAGKKLANFLYSGSGYKTLKALPLYSIKMKEEKLGKEAATIVIARSESHNIAFIQKGKWKGSRHSSNCMIREKVYKSLDNNLSLPVQCKGGYPPISLFISKVDEKIMVIQDSPRSDREKLIAALVDYNSVMAVRGVLDGLNQSLSATNGFQNDFIKTTGSDSNVTTGSNTQGTSGSSADALVKMQADWMKKADDTMLSAKKAVNKMIAGAGSLRDIDAMFVAQHRKNQERSLNAIRK